MIISFRWWTKNVTVKKKLFGKKCTKQCMSTSQCKGMHLFIHSIIHSFASVYEVATKMLSMVALWSSEGVKHRPCFIEVIMSLQQCLDHQQQHHFRIRETDSQAWSLKLRPSYLCSNKPFRWFWCTAEFENWFRRREFSLWAAVSWKRKNVNSTLKFGG